jgi:hypothetical protein
MRRRAEVDVRRQSRVDPAQPAQLVNVVALVPGQVKRWHAMYGEDVQDET